MSKVIGYRGIEAPDIILYLSRIMKNLGLKVLICDYSPAGEFEYCIPSHNDISAETGYIDYRGVDYTKKRLDRQVFKGYDVILMNCGYSDDCPEISLCRHVVYVTDTQKAHIKKLSMLKMEGEGECHIVLRDVVHGGVKISEYLKELKDSTGSETVYRLKLNKKDIKLSCLLQYNDIFRFHGISQGLYDYMVNITGLYFPDKDAKTIVRAVNKAMKGA